LGLLSFGPASDEEACVRKSAYTAMTFIDVATRKDCESAALDEILDEFLELGNTARSVEECIDVYVIRRLMESETV
jgi:hypothetical protein